jgi:hypothetical protein
MDTAELALLSQPGAAFFGIHASNGGRVMLLPGGMPLRHAGQIIGATGVSEGSDEELEPPDGGALAPGWRRVPVLAEFLAGDPTQHFSGVVDSDPQLGAPGIAIPSPCARAESHS